MGQGPVSPCLKTPPVVVFRPSVRLSYLIALFTVELLAISIWLDTTSLTLATGLAKIVGDSGADILRGVIAAGATAVALGYRRLRGNTDWAQFAPVPLAWAYLAAHTITITVFGWLSSHLFRTNVSGTNSNALTIAWLSAGLAAITFGGLAFIPFRIWRVLAQSTASLAPWSIAAGVITPLLSKFSWWLWEPATALTFRLVSAVLAPLVVVVSDPAKLTIGSKAFQVTIASSCSGLEGVGLMLVFGAGWLLLFQEEFHFPQALMLIPACMALIYLVNVFRIAALILIGDAGAEKVALGGFHSQAGWIGFNAVALGMLALAGRIPWISTEPQRTAANTKENPPAWFVAPFVAMLAAGMISHAVASEFEWAYPFRVVAVGAVVLWFRSRYQSLLWRFGWMSVGAGVGAFLLWILVEQLIGGPPATSMPTQLTTWPGWASFGWKFMRVLGAVVTVPIAEELAFRGFLMRRWMSEIFETVNPTDCSWTAILISSLVFGAMHGERWFAGTLAGIIYAMAYRKRGRIGDAVAAHATTNALLAAWVLVTGNWQYW